jgi:hypothetical protein
VLERSVSRERTWTLRIFTKSIVVSILDFLTHLSQKDVEWLTCKKKNHNVKFFRALVVKIDKESKTWLVFKMLSDFFLKKMFSGRGLYVAFATPALVAM